MSDDRSETTVDLSAWVRRGAADPVKHRQRQVTEVLLRAIALTPLLGSHLYLKGGILMALAYGSPRSTADVDFSIEGPPEQFAERVREVLDPALLRAAAQCGYPGLLCRVQRIAQRPRPEIFATANAPALQVTIGSARGAHEATRLANGQATHVLRVDISFKEPIETVQRLIIAHDQTVAAYGLHDLIAEKFRAILQQTTRAHPGQRRQDVYDIVLLLGQFDFDAEERTQIHAILIAKSQERGFTPDRAMIALPAIVSRLRADWPTLQSELEERLPDFDGHFAIVRGFYEGLPWTN